MRELFDMRTRAMRRDRAARVGAELFLLERAFADCLERVSLVHRRFERALLLGCPHPAWPERLGPFSATIEARDPGPLFASAAAGELLVEDAWEPVPGTYDLVLAVGTLDTINELPLALGLIRRSMRDDGLLLGALPGGDTLPQLRNAMRAADAVGRIAVPHVHPRIEASALAPLLSGAGFAHPVVDIDRVAVSYPSLNRLVDDLRRMAATNILRSRPRFMDRRARAAAVQSFAAAGEHGRTIETFEILHFAAWAGRR
ncbi:MAG TPA: methyltransferase domain-containing protein [Sphingomicrobium sp.]|nr:methyltransferase domain-containing protein [Sphingomicrobium sp.]